MPTRSRSTARSKAAARYKRVDKQGTGFVQPVPTAARRFFAYCGSFQTRGFWRESQRRGGPCATRGLFTVSLLNFVCGCCKIWVCLPRTACWPAAYLERGCRLFGYIRPFKPEMKVREFEAYRSIYCGLCKTLKKRYGFLAQMTLSYDFAFLSMLKMAVGGDKVSFVKKRCPASPFKKKVCAVSDEALSYGADVAMIMLHYKLLDNVLDEGFWKGAAYRIASFFMKRQYRKAARRLPDIEKTVAAYIRMQSEAERENTDSIDKAAHPTAFALSAICEKLCEDEKQKRVLSRFGYLIGRWIYIMDAYDDYQKDLQAGRYNPIVNKLGLCAADEETDRQVEEYVRGVLNLTVGELSDVYGLLRVQRFGSILENVVYLGLPHMLQDIKSVKEKKFQ